MTFSFDSLETAINNLPAGEVDVTKLAAAVGIEVAFTQFDADLSCEDFTEALFLMVEEGLLGFDEMKGAFIKGSSSYHAR